MADYFEIRNTSPSIAFLFARLGALLDSPSDPLGVPSHHFSNQYPPIGGFAIGFSGLSLALSNLHPLLYQSQSWFKLVQAFFRRENMGSVGDHERGSSSGVGAKGTRTDIATSRPSSVPSSSLHSMSVSPRRFHALKEKCTLKANVFDNFRDRFQFLLESRACLPKKGEKAFAFAHGEVCFYDAAFLCGLIFPIHPFIMELLNHLGIALGQLMLNSWRIVISCMVIWTTIADGDMITLNKLAHLYRLKEFREFGYYELVPWDRKSCFVADLLSSFRY